MSNGSILSALAGIVLLAGSAAVPAAETGDADAIADAQYATMRESLCPAPNKPPVDYAAITRYEDHKMDPAQVFDNLYFIGMDTISAWALTTSEGIILLDAMLAGNVRETVVAGLETLGLDPADIKYAIISHAHNDHFGGAKYLQDTYGTRIVMSGADWEHMKTWPQMGEPAPFPEKDIVVADGGTITLGDTTVRIVVTPGHTPGTISPLIPVRDGDERHLAAYWGGAAMSFLEPEGLRQYISGVERYAGIAADAGVDVALSNHPFADGSLLKLKALTARGEADPHPFVVGPEGVSAWLAVLKECAEAHLAQKTTASE